jgi:DNA-binding HxlR family transcriptional regulator
MSETTKLADRLRAKYPSHQVTSKSTAAPLAQHGELGYAALMTETKAANSPLLASTLNRMRRDGVVIRSALPTTPPRTLYALAVRD